MSAQEPSVRARSGVRAFRTEADLAAAVAGFFADAASQAIAERGAFMVALAGGSTPRVVHAMLVQEPLRSRVDWPRVRFFFGDERCVPPDDAESNYRMARETLLEPLGIDAAHVHRMRGEDPPALAAAGYASELRRELNGDLRLDLIMLGMGPDGHTASLFPGSSPLTDDEMCVRAPFVAKVDMYRITLTPRVINAAGDVIVATAGAAKATALAKVLDGPFDPTVYPAQILRPVDGRLTWFADDAALGRA